MKTCNASLVFPPAWTYITGSAHAALPMLKAFLEANDIGCETTDLNQQHWLAVSSKISGKGAVQAVASGTKELNALYFDAQDEADHHAAQFGGEWPLLLGFGYQDHPEQSSVRSFESLARDSPFEAVYASYVAAVLRSDFDVVGMAIACDRQIVSAMQLSWRLRESGYAGRIVLGGNTVSRLAEEFRSCTWMFRLVDGGIVFQGEEALLGFCQLHGQRNLWHTVPGLIWKNDAGEIVANAHRINKIGNLVPCPDYSGLDLCSYWGVNHLCLVGSRGCYYGKCDFCPIPYGWGPNGYAGDRTAEKVFGDMCLLYERHGIPRFKFTDEALSPVFMNNLATLVRRAHAPFEWEGYTRLEKAWLDPAFSRHVSDGGFRKGYFGLEVLPSENRSVLNKGDFPDPRLLLGNCAASGVKTHLFCMFGYPGTGVEDAERTTEFLLENKDSIDTADIFGWGYARHTKATGVEIIPDPERDWALEYRYRPTEAGVLWPEQVQTLCEGFEDLLWDEAPQFLHPVYRLVSPWKTQEALPRLEVVPALVGSGMGELGGGRPG